MKLAAPSSKSTAASATLRTHRSRTDRPPRSRRLAGRCRSTLPSDSDRGSGPFREWYGHLDDRSSGLFPRGLTPQQVMPWFSSRTSRPFLCVLRGQKLLLWAENQKTLPAKDAKNSKLSYEPMLTLYARTHPLL